MSVCLCVGVMDCCPYMNIINVIRLCDWSLLCIISVMFSFLFLQSVTKGARNKIILSIRKLLKRPETLAAIEQVRCSMIITGTPMLNTQVTYYTYMFCK